MQPELNALKVVREHMRSIHHAILNHKRMILIIILWLIVSPLQLVFAHVSSFGVNESSLYTDMVQSHGTHCQSNSNADQNSFGNDCEQCGHCLAFPQYFSSLQPLRLSNQYSVELIMEANIRLPIDSPPPR